MPRIKVRMVVTYTVEGDRERRSVTADIGPGGLFIQAKNPPAVGKACTVHVQTELEGELVLQGRVTWAKKDANIPGVPIRSGFGVRLESAPEAWYALLLLEDPQLLSRKS
jgi:hypothetical protein